VEGEVAGDVGWDVNARLAGLVGQRLPAARNSSQVVGTVVTLSALYTIARLDQSFGIHRSGRSSDTRRSAQDKVSDFTSEAAI
jgi:hypothetical protein